MEQPKRPRGRPRKRDGEKADVRIVFVLYPHEARVIEEWAERNQVTRVDALRDILKVATERMAA